MTSDSNINEANIRDIIAIEVSPEIISKIRGILVISPFNYPNNNNNNNGYLIRR